MCKNCQIFPKIFRHVFLRFHEITSRKQLILNKFIFRKKCTCKFCTNFANFAHAKFSGWENSGLGIGMRQIFSVQNLCKNAQNLSKIAKICKKFPCSVFSKMAFFPGYVKFFRKMQVHMKNEIFEIFGFFAHAIFCHFFLEKFGLSVRERALSKKCIFVQNFVCKICANFGFLSIAHL